MLSSSNMTHIVDSRLHKHSVDLEVYMKKCKEEFEERWKRSVSSNAKIKDFIQIKTLGTGSFGRVVLVRHRENKKVYALKILDKEHVVKMRQLEHIKSEIRVLGAVKFDFIVGMEFCFKNFNYIFLAMPFINGGEMFLHLRIMKRFDETLSKFYAAQVVLGFDYLHTMGIVYRDLKPENILLDKDGYLKLTDLGFCKRIEDSRTYTLCGTPEYLAPEVILSKGYSFSVDWWSLGVLVFEMACGYPPFYAKEPMKIYEKIVAGKFNMPNHFSKSLRSLLPNLLQVDRSKRFGVLKEGSRDIKAHEWYRGVDWDAILYKRVKPAFIPKVSGIDDVSNFDQYDEETLKQSSRELYPNEFKDIAV